MSYELVMEDEEGEDSNLFGRRKAITFTHYCGSEVIDGSFQALLMPKMWS
jgi:hypothetical protein